MLKVAVPSISNVLEGRKKRIEDNLDKAVKAKKEAEETIVLYEESLHKARNEAQKVHALALSKLAEEVESSEEKVIIELSNKMEECESQIQGAINGAMDSIRESAIEVAGDAILRLTGQPPDSKKLLNAVDRSVKVQDQETG